MMHKIQNIQALRGIAVLFVLMVHIGLVEKKYSGHPILPDFVQFGMSGVDIFFVISGFIMMTISLQQKKMSKMHSNFCIQEYLEYIQSTGFTVD